MSDAIHFFGVRDESTAYLSNFFGATFVLDGERWQTVEHFYQAQKFTDAVIMAEVRDAATPGAAKRVAYRAEYRDRVRPDWEHAKRHVMLRGVAAKFCLSETSAIPLIRRLLTTTDAQLLEANPNDGYWGVGAAGDGSNHLGRTLMAIRAVLLACDHEHLQCEPLPEPVLADVFAPTVEGEEQFHHRVVAAAWALLADPEWDPAYRAPGLHIHVLSSPLYGQGIKTLRETLRPWLGVPMSALWAQDSFGWPVMVMQAQAPSPLAAELLQGLQISQKTYWRFGRLAVCAVGTRPADREWMEPFTATEPTPPWWNLFHDAMPEREWALHRVSVIAGANVDNEFNTRQYAQPVAHAIRLEFFAQDAQGVVDTAKAPRSIELRVMTDAPTKAHVINGSDAPTASSDAGGTWKTLLCSAPLGALPNIEAAFAKYFAYEGIELPSDVVIERRACAEVDDGMDGLSGWLINVAFGKDADGDFMDMDSDHRKCGPRYVRYHEDGRETERHEAIDPNRFPRQAISVPLEHATFVEADLSAPSAVQEVEPSDAPALKYVFRRSLGVLVMVIGGVIGSELAMADPRPMQMIVFSLVMLVSGALLAWRPAWFR